MGRCSIRKLSEYGLGSSSAGCTALPVGGLSFKSPNKQKLARDPIMSSPLVLANLSSNWLYNGVDTVGISKLAASIAGSSAQPGSAAWKSPVGSAIG